MLIQTSPAFSSQDLIPNTGQENNTRRGFACAEEEALEDPWEEPNPGLQLCQHDIPEHCRTSWLPSSTKSQQIREEPQGS